MVDETIPAFVMWALLTCDTLFAAVLLVARSLSATLFFEFQAVIQVGIALF